MKYADELVILVEVDTLLIEIGRCSGMEMNVGKKAKIMISSKQSSPIRIMIDQKQSVNVEFFNYLDSMII